MTRWFRQCDRRYPFLWEDTDQPEARWHRGGEGPVQYLASTPEGAWAEFLRHEEITDEDDLPGIERALWVVDVDDGSDATAKEPGLPPEDMTGGEATYPTCQQRAGELRTAGARALVAPSAAVKNSQVTGSTVDAGPHPHTAAAQVLVLFGTRPDLVGWLAVIGAPPAEVLPRVNHLHV